VFRPHNLGAMGLPVFKPKNYDGAEVDTDQVKPSYRDSHLT
jgi:hypothetical protein